MKILHRNMTAKIALVAGLVLLALWSVLGAGTSLAWYMDETPVVKNVFNFAEFEIAVEYKNDTMTDYDPLELDTSIFNDKALYEPGYTQVVYLKVKNLSTIDIEYKLAVDLRSVITAKNVYGNEIYLPEYLRYGVLFGAEEAELDRELAQLSAPRELAELKLNSYSEWDSVIMPPDSERYVAIVVYMPQDVGNEANCRDDHLPEVELGITVFAQQTID